MSRATLIEMAIWLAIGVIVLFLWRIERQEIPWRYVLIGAVLFFALRLLERGIRALSTLL